MYLTDMEVFASSENSKIFYIRSSACGAAKNPEDFYIVGRHGSIFVVEMATNSRYSRYDACMDQTVVNIKKSKWYKELELRGKSRLRKGELCKIYNPRMDKIEGPPSRAGKGPRSPKSKPLAKTRVGTRVNPDPAKKRGIKLCRQNAELFYKGRPCILRKSAGNNAWSVVELRKEAKKYGVIGYGSMNKRDLCIALLSLDEKDAAGSVSKDVSKGKKYRDSMDNLHTSKKDMVKNSPKGPAKMRTKKHILGSPSTFKDRRLTQTDYDISTGYYKGKKCAGDVSGSNAWSLRDLRQEAKNMGIVGYSRLGMSELCKKIAMIRKMETIEYKPPSGLRTIDEFLGNDKSGIYGDTKELIVSNYDVYGWLYYLEKYIPQDIMCVPDIFSTLPESGEIFSMGFVDDEALLVISPNVEITLRECSDKRFTVFVFTIIRSYDIGETFEGSHANALIFDNIKKEILRFEPNGYGENLYKEAQLDKLLREYAKNLGGEWTYKSPESYCPLGPQEKEHGYSWHYIWRMEEIFGDLMKKEIYGYCSVWTVMFIHLKMLNPDADDKAIIDYMNASDNDRMSIMVRQYLAFLLNLAMSNDWRISKKKFFKEGDLVTTSYYISSNSLRTEIDDGVIVHIDDNRAVVLTEKPRLVEGKEEPNVVPVRFGNMVLYEGGDPDGLRSRIRAKYPEYAEEFPFI